MEETANEMFNKLGYEKREVHLDIELYRSKNDYTEITFDLRDRTIVVENDENEAVYFGIKELQAISKRCLELRWRECTSIEFAEKLIEDLQEKIRNLTEDNKNNIKIKLDFNGQNYTVDTKIPAKYKDGEILYLADEYKEPTRVKFFRYKVNQTVNEDFILYCEVLNLSNNKFEYYLEKNLFKNKSVASDEYLKRKYC